MSNESPPPCRMSFLKNALKEAVVHLCPSANPKLSGSISELWRPAHLHKRRGRINNKAHFLHVLGQRPPQWYQGTSEMVLQWDLYGLLSIALLRPSRSRQRFLGLPSILPRKAEVLRGKVQCARRCFRRQWKLRSVCADARRTSHSFCKAPISQRRV